MSKQDIIDSMSSLEELSIQLKAIQRLEKYKDLIKTPEKDPANRSKAQLELLLEQAKKHVSEFAREKSPENLKSQYHAKLKEVIDIIKQNEDLIKIFDDFSFFEKTLGLIKKIKDENLNLEFLSATGETNFKDLTKKLSEKKDASDSLIRTKMVAAIENFEEDWMIFLEQNFTEEQINFISQKKLPESIAKTVSEMRTNIIKQKKAEKAATKLAKTDARLEEIYKNKALKFKETAQSKVPTAQNLIENQKISQTQKVIIILEQIYSAKKALSPIIKIQKYKEILEGKRKDAAKRTPKQLEMLLKSAQKEYAKIEDSSNPEEQTMLIEAGKKHIIESLFNNPEEFKDLSNIAFYSKIFPLIKKVKEPILLEYFLKATSHNSIKELQQSFLEHQKALKNYNKPEEIAWRNFLKEKLKDSQYKNL